MQPRRSSLGGDGQDEGVAFQDGADGIRGAGAGIHLTLDGDSTVTGGNGAGNAGALVLAISAGGAGVNLSGTIRVGDATASGGAGTPPGPAYGNAAGQQLPASLHLAATPALQDAAGATFVTPGQQV